MSKVYSSKYLPDIAGLFCLITFLVKVIASKDTLLGDGDPFWHIKAGSVMIDSKALLTSDIFSHTASGTPWITHEWLAEILMSLLHRIGGLGGLVCGALLLVSLSFWILFKITGRFAGEWVSLLFVSLAFILSGTHLIARPHLFTWFFVTVTLGVLLNGGRWLYWLPIIMIVWANMHGGFVFGLLLQTIFLLGTLLEELARKNRPNTSMFAHLRRPLIVLAMSIFASSINPFGFELLLFPFHVAKGIFLANIAEWQSPNMQLLWQFRYFLIFLFFIMSFKITTFSWIERLLFAFFLNAALLNARNISLMVLVITPFLARICDQWMRESSLKLRINSTAKQIGASRVTGPLFTFIMGLIFITTCALTKNNYNQSPFEPSYILNAERRYIEELTHFIKAYKPAGNLFNEYNLGGYLLYAIDPPPKVFIDGRADMYGERIFSDYLDISLSESMRESLLNEYEIGWIVFDKGSSLVEDLSRKRQWEIVFNNEYFVVMSRKSTELLSIDI